MTPVEKSFTGLGGTNIVYDVYEPAGPPVGLILVAHGVAEHAGRYGHVAEVLAGLGLRVVIPDHRGHGRSGGKRLLARDMSEFTTDLETLRRLEVVDGRPTYLLGHSMGGLIALDYALDHQSSLTALILSGPAVLPGDDISPLLMKVAKVIGKVVPGLPGQKLSSASISRDPAVVKAYDEDPLNFRGALPAGVGGAMLRTMDTFPSRLPSLKLPAVDSGHRPPGNTLLSMDSPCITAIWLACAPSSAVSEATAAMIRPVFTPASSTMSSSPAQDSATEPSAAMTATAAAMNLTTMTPSAM